MSVCVTISSIFSLTHTGLAKRIQHCWTLLKSVERGDQTNATCWIQNFGLKRSGTKIYPESLENKLSPCWRFQIPVKIINRVTLCDSKRMGVPESGNCNSKCPVFKGLAPCRCEEPWEDPGRHCVGSSEIHWRQAPESFEHKKGYLFEQRLLKLSSLRHSWLCSFTIP